MTSRLNEIFERGTVGVTFTKTEKGQCAATAEQQFSTDGGQSLMRHSVIASSFAEALEQIAGRIDHCAELKTNVVRLNGP